MLGGIDPIIIFQFSKLVPKPDRKNLIKLWSQSTKPNPVYDYEKDFTTTPLPPIPIYLNENLTGLFVDTENKNLDFDTSADTLINGAAPVVTQKPINSTVKITLHGLKDSIGLALISAIADLVLPKATSHEYSITYIHGATIVIAGLLHTFAIEQNSDNDLATVTLELTKVLATKSQKPATTEVTRSTTTTPLDYSNPNLPPTSDPVVSPLGASTPAAPAGAAPAPVGNFLR